MYSPRGRLATPTEFGFPFEPYEIQQRLMAALFVVLENKKIGIFESPTGTGKSLTLTCGALHWLEKHEALVRQELRERQEEVNRELAALDAESSKATDWLTIQHAAREQRDQLKELDGLRALLDAQEQHLKELREQHTKEQRRKRKREVLLHRDNEPNSHTEESCQLDAAADDTESNDEDDLVEEEMSAQRYRSVQIFFSSRTHSQLSQVLREVKRTEYGQRMRCISLASRQQLCIHPQVRSLTNAAAINERCLDMAGSRGAANKATTTKCAYKTPSAVHELYKTALVDILDIEDLVSEGQVTKACPYYATRAAAQNAQLVMLPYQMLLHRRTRIQSGIDIRGAVVIIDEAHNLLDTIAQLHSCELTLAQLLSLQRQIGAYKMQYAARFSTANLLRINQLLYVVRRLAKLLQLPATTSRILRTYELAAEGEFFNIDLYELLAFCERVRFAQKLQGHAKRAQSPPLRTDHKSSPAPTAALGLLRRLQCEHEERVVHKKASAAETQPDEESPVTATTNQQTQTAPIRPLLAFLEALTESADDGRVLLSAAPESAAYKYVLLNPGAHFAEILREARAIIIAGGTMQPTAELTAQLFHSCPERVEEHFYDHVVPADAVLPLVVARGPTGVPLCFNYAQRNSETQLVELGRCLLNFCNVIPAGVVCFLPSYDYLDAVMSHLQASGMLASLAAKKQVFHESRSRPGAQTVEQLLVDYTAAIRRRPPGDGSGGALLLSVVGGKLSEGLNFADDLGRGVIVVGLPYPNRQSPELLERLKYLDGSLGPGSGNDYYENLCMKAINQCIGRSVRHIRDYACVCLLDERYSAERIRNKLPQWIGRSLQLPPLAFGASQAAIAKFFRHKRVTRHGEP